MMLEDILLTDNERGTIINTLLMERASLTHWLNDEKKTLTEKEIAYVESNIDKLMNLAHKIIQSSIRSVSYNARTETLSFNGINGRQTLVPLSEMPTIDEKET